MLKKLALIAILVPFAAAPVFAQATRAEVKAEAASANKAGKIATGEEPMTGPKSKSTANRAVVKGEAASANKMGTIATGEESNAPKSKSTANRAAVKAEAASANKAGKIATGEASKP